ncbi:MAG: radical SAM protein [Nanoarchaeota archaeon]|nr:radical SAM protein [Nanoarchaeota archaeon]
MRKHYFIRKEDNIPLIGVHVFGLIDRGTNIIQVRPISGCPLNCVYCSVDEGPDSKKLNTYEVEVKFLIEEFNKIVDYKECADIEAHIDGIGEPVLYSKIVELVKGIRKNTGVKTISMQSNGVLLKPELIKSLAKAGLDRINLSINSLNAEIAKRMAGSDWYDINKIKETAEQIVGSGMELLIAPVLVPGYNEESMSDLIIFAKKLGAKLGIQRFERHKHGRKLNVKEQNWYSFNNLLKGLEKKHGLRLLLSKTDFNIHKAKSLPIVFKKGEKIKGRVVLPGWLKNEVIISVKNRLVTVFNSKNKIKDSVTAKIIKTKHNLYLAEKI